MRKRNDIYINDKGSDDFRAKPTLPLFSFYQNLLKRDLDCCQTIGAYTFYSHPIRDFLNT